ncbi:MAG: hypothetical protein IPL61_10620 [Myxococcales bacterium]|nr:hypothetical protein [Myxococcales bacterium]
MSGERSIEEGSGAALTSGSMQTPSPAAHLDAGLPQRGTNVASGSADVVADRLRAMPEAHRGEALQALQAERGNHFTQSVIALVDGAGAATRASDGDGATLDNAPTRLEFDARLEIGEGIVGDRRQVPAYIYNVGDDPVGIARVRVGGSSALSARVAERERGTGATDTIAPGGYAIVLVTFEPHAVGDHSGLVELTTDLGESFQFFVAASAQLRPLPASAPAAPATAAAAPDEDDGATRQPKAPAAAPTPPPEPAAAPPVHVPVPLHVDTHQLQFAAVVGRPVLPQAVTITNPNEDTVRVDVSVEESGSFSVPRDPLFVRAERKNQPSEVLPVGFEPTRSGHHAGVLVLRYGDQAPLRIALGGDAMKIAGTAEEDAARDPLRPPSIEELPEAQEPHTVAQRRHLRDRAADAISTVPMNYQALIPHADEAVARFANTIASAGASLQQRVVTWLSQEGIAALGSIRANPDEEAAKFLLTEVVDAAADRHPVTMAISKTLQLAYDVHAAGQLNAEIDGLQARLGTVGALASGHAGAASRALFRQYGSLLTQFASAREALTRSADADVRRDLGAATRPDDYGKRSYDEARDNVANYHRTMNRMAEAVKLLAAAATDVPARLDAGFAQLLDRYLRYRATGIADGEVVGRDTQAERRKLRVSGSVNFDVPNRYGAGYSMVLSEIDFGRYGSDDMSQTMQDHAYAKHLSEMRGWVVEIRLIRAHDSGAIVLRQSADGARQVDGVDDHVARAGGEVALWQYLDSRPLRQLQ